FRFTESLKDETKQRWTYIINHWFVQNIHKGYLTLETFKNYIIQYIYYLKHYGKIHAFAADHANDFGQAASLAKKAQNTAEAEITVHKGHARILNITDDDINHF